MNKDFVQTFVTIVQVKTISRAAEALYTSQSTISYRLQSLEAELDTKLFQRWRGNKSVILTESGINFYELALKWLELEYSMHHLDSARRLGKVTIGSMDSINQYLISSIIQKLRDDLPELEMVFTSYHSQEIYSRLTSHNLDLGFAFFPAYYNLLATPVFREPMYMIAPLNSIYPIGPVHPLQLEKRNQVLFSWDNNSLNWNNEWWDEREAPYVHVDSCALLTTFLTKPENWAVCPASVATTLKALGFIEIHEFVEKPPDRLCYLLHRKRSKENPNSAIDLFLDNFYKLLQNHPWRYK